MKRQCLASIGVLLCILLCVHSVLPIAFPSMESLSVGMAEPAVGALQNGDSGEEVQELQIALAELGYLGENLISGNYDDLTEVSVFAFQLDHSIDPTGIADNETRQAILEQYALVVEQQSATPTPQPTDIPPEYYYPTLKSGDNNYNVVVLQLRLIQLGYFKKTVTGKYDKATVKAVKEYQSANKHKADGIATLELQIEILGEGARDVKGKKYSAFDPEKYSTPTPKPTPTPKITPTPKPTATPKPKKSKVTTSVYNGGDYQNYIGNKKTKKFHYPWCHDVNRMKDSNKVSLSSLNQAIQKGYSPCGHCNP